MRRTVLLALNLPLAGGAFLACLVWRGALVPWDPWGAPPAWAGPVLAAWALTGLALVVMDRRYLEMQATMLVNCVLALTLGYVFAPVGAAMLLLWFFHKRFRAPRA